MQEKQLIATLQRFPHDKQTTLPSDAIMRQVVYALIPGITLQIIIWGSAVLMQLLLAIFTAFLCELFVALLRKRCLTALDLSSGLLTAILLVASIPATAPWYLIITAVVFGLLVGKHIYGGVGFNIFNPAIVGFCVVYLSFSAQINLYPHSYINFSDSWKLIFLQGSPTDALTGATKLALLKAGGTIDNDIWYYWWINIAWLVGGIYLWIRNIADWRLSITFFTVFIVLIAVLNNSSIFAISTTQHLQLGALIFTSCFIITDPVTAATGRLGRFFYASLAAIFAAIIRQYSNMPDSMAFAVLLANLSAPMIDNYTRPQYIKSK